MLRPVAGLRAPPVRSLRFDIVVISRPAMSKDPLRLAIQVSVYVVLYFGTALVFGQLFLWLGGYLAGNTSAVLFSALSANWLALRIYENRSLVDLGFWWNAASRCNLALD